MRWISTTRFGMNGLMFRCDGAFSILSVLSEFDRISTLRMFTTNINDDNTVLVSRVKVNALSFNFGIVKVGFEEGSFSFTISRALAEGVIR